MSAAVALPILIMSSITSLTVLTRAQTEGDLGYEDGENYDYYDESALAQGPTFDVLVVNVTVITGQTAVLPCSIDYLSKYRVAWLDQNTFTLTYEDRRVIDDSRFSVVRPSTKEWNLQIREVRTEDDGVYRCTVNTNPVRSKVVMLYVKAPPTIFEHNSTKSTTVIEEGDTVGLECIATGIPEPEVTWFRRHSDAERLGFCATIGSRIISTGARRAIARGRRLTIVNASRGCHDVYECVASNGVPPNAHHEMSVIVEFPPQVSIPVTRLGQARGRETILECKITAFPQAIDYWQKDGKRIASTGRHRTDTWEDGGNAVTLSLRISNIEQSDYGYYECVAANRLGRDKQVIQLFETHMLNDAESYGQSETSLIRNVPWKPSVASSPPSSAVFVPKPLPFERIPSHRRIDNTNEKIKHVRPSANMMVLSLATGSLVSRCGYLSMASVAMTTAVVAVVSAGARCWLFSI